METPTYPKTPKQARAWFTSHGISITDWCKFHGVDRYIVTDLLRGTLKGSRGESHRAAILLGLKADPAKAQPAAALLALDQLAGVERRTTPTRRAA